MSATPHRNPPAEPLASPQALQLPLEDRLNALLSSNQFTVESYLNMALSNPTQEQMASTALSLQLQAASCHEDIGKIGAELQAILPRCAADMQRVTVALDGLRADCKALQSEVPSTSSLDTLTTLHTLKHQLTASHDILQAAATWDHSLASVAPLLAASDLVRAVQALQNLEAGQRALAKMPQNEERLASLQKVRTQVTSLLQPQLQKSLDNTASLPETVSLYRQLDQLSVLIYEYVTHRPKPLHQAWFAYSMHDDDLVTWLPPWLDRVVTWLEDEQRQCEHLFQDTSIVLKLLQECFRPLAGSMASRLETLYSATPGRSSTGDLQPIATVYGDLLQFLSLVYETVTQGRDSDDSRAVFTEITQAFRQVLQPFVAYQTNLPQLEHEALSNQVRKLHFPGASNWNEVPTSIETMRSVSLPVDALGRWELLMGGYNPAETLQVLDQVWSELGSKLAHAVQTTLPPLEGFDDAHVATALEILYVAASYKSNLDNLEDMARDRLGVLVSRMASQNSRDKLLNGTNSFALPASLSAVEIDSIVTKAVCGSDAEESINSSLAVLRRLQESNAPLLIQAHATVAALKRTCHMFVVDACSAVPRQQLSSMSHLPSWQKTQANDDTDYGTPPQGYITAVGEHMLALVQALEPFSMDAEALEKVQPVMESVHDAASDAWQQLLTTAGVTKIPVIDLMTGKSLKELLGVVEEPIEEEEGGPDASALFCDAWLDAVANAVTGRLMECIFLIPSLSPTGCEHLKADLDYLHNVLAALALPNHPHPLLAHVVSLATLEDVALVQQIQSRNATDPMQSFLATLEKHIARLRSIATLN